VLDADYNMALTLLLRYPELTRAFRPQTLVVDALYLREHFTQEGARDLILKYTGNAPDISPSGAQTPPLSATIKTARSTNLSPVHFGRQTSNFESIFQEAAKGMYLRGEKWGINKAVREAVSEVRKGVREIQGPTSPEMSDIAGSLSRSPKRRDPHNVPRVVALQLRNEALAKMLKTATDQLWDFQKEFVEKNTDEQSVKALSMAIARVQFVQVYLEDPSIPLILDEEDDTLSIKSNEQVVAVADTLANTNKTAPVSMQESPKLQISTGRNGPTPSSPLAVRKTRPSVEKKPEQSTMTSPSSTLSPATAASPPNFHQSRPSLAQSSFSWMLGQDEKPASFVQAGPMPSEKRRSKGFLFGDEDDDASSTVGLGLKNESRSKKKDKGKRISRAIEEDDGFDLSTLKEGLSESGKS
jgi:TBC1 domain family protein 5